MEYNEKEEDNLVVMISLLNLWSVLQVDAIMVKVKMPGGSIPAFLQNWIKEVRRTTNASLINGWK